MTFLCTSDSITLGEYFGLTVYLNPKFFLMLLTPVFPSCVTDCHSKNIFFTACRAVYLHQCGMDLSVNDLWYQFKAIFTFTTAFHTSSFKETQQQKKHRVATSCPSGTDLAGHKCLWGTWSRVWLQETQIVPKLHRAQLMLTRISTKRVHSVQATAAH